MKTTNLIYSISIGLCFWIFPSCKNQLAMEPLAVIAPEQYYNTEADLNAALSGVYINLNRSEMYGSFMITNYINGADEIWGGGGGIPDYTYDSNNIDIGKFWRECYQGIYKANLLLDNLDKSPVSEEIKESIKGEALFLRGYYFYLLAINFGGVPMLLDSEVSLNNVHLARSPLETVYEQIISDMKAAEPLVKNISEIGFSGRISKSAVRGILARVFLTMTGEPLNDISKYQDVLEWTTKVIETNEHELNKDYRQIFINHCQDIYDIKESIWEIEFLIVPGGPYAGKGRLGNMLGINCNDMTIGVASSSNTCGKLYKIYDDAYDLRRDWNVSTYSYTGNTPNVVKTYFADNNVYKRFPGKWRREYELTEPKQKNNTPINYPVLRYSDILLMYAEADNYINKKPSAKAIEYVNHVRRRGHGKYLNMPNSSISESIKEITITNGGSGYVDDEDDPVIISLSGGEGEGFKAHANIQGDQIASVIIDSPGVKFTSPPIITIKGGGGAGATAVVSLTSISDADLKSEQTATYDNFLAALQDERLRELCFEGTRRFDLIRWGILISTMKAVTADVRANEPNISAGATKAGDNITSRNVLYPIPQYEMGLNRELVQNPGY